MTDEKKGSSFFKTLIILCIIGGLGAGSFWYIKNADNKASMANVIRTEITSLVKKYMKKDQGAVLPVPVQNNLQKPETENQAPESLNIESNEIAAELNSEIAPEIPNSPDNTELIPNQSEAEPPVMIEDATLSEDFIAQTNEIQGTEEIQQIDEVQSPSEATPPVLEENNTPQITYTWADFNAGKPCTASDQFDIQDPQLLELVRSYCKHPSMDVWHQWMQTFREAKKTYYIQQKMKEKSKYIKYLKVIPYLLFDVNNTQQTGSSIEAKLNQIETAIYKHQTQTAVDLLNSLNEADIQLNFNMTLAEGKNLLKIQEAFNHHMNGEENND